jgi:hypothetical protein
MNIQSTAPTQNGAPVKSATEARQGVTGHGVRYVLLWGLVGVVAVFAIAGFVFFER